jgi:hypothetical protein
LSRSNPLRRALLLTNGATMLDSVLSLLAIKIA